MLLAIIVFASDYGCSHPGMPLDLIDPVETVTPPSSRRQAEPSLYLIITPSPTANRIQVDALEILAHNALPDLLDRLALQRHLVGVIPLPSRR